MPEIIEGSTREPIIWIPEDEMGEPIDISSAQISALIRLKSKKEGTPRFEGAMQKVAATLLDPQDPFYLPQRFQYSLRAEDVSPPATLEIEFTLTDGVNPYRVAGDPLVILKRPGG